MRLDSQLSLTLAIAIVAGGLVDVKDDDDAIS